MATTAQAKGKPTPRRLKAAGPKESLYQWEGRDKMGKKVRGEMRAGGEAVVQATLRRQGIQQVKVKKQKMSGGRKVTDKDISLFTRQLATMMRSGVPLLQAFDIGIKGSGNPTFAKMLNDIRSDIEGGASLSQAFSKYPVHFDRLFVSLVAAGEQAGILDSLLDRLATYKEKILAIKGKIKSAMFYPVAVVVVASIVVAVIMLFVIPEFKNVFASFGADLPVPTQIVIAMSDYFVANWYIIFGIVFAAIFSIGFAYKRSPKMQIIVDRLILQLPVVGDIVRKATIARWNRTLSTMFAAGVPLVEALDSVGSASGNHVYVVATKQIQNEVSTGTSLTVSMQNVDVFPTMVVQMVSIGEESGQLDAMLGKVADFYEAEVDDAVAGLSTLLEPLIMVFLGVVIGGMIVAMYLPIFKIGAVVG
ncbi:MAG: type II secretion system F family protein [Rhodocyclaceae bacterium]